MGDGVMADKSAIEWTDASWTPIRARNMKTGKIGWHCEHDTTGCEFCYSEAFNKRLGTGLPFKPGHRKDIELFLDETMLMQPLRWKKPRMIFVCSMTDLFADFVNDNWIDCVFAVMALCPQHTFQVLTKRAERMREYVSEIVGDPQRFTKYAARGCAIARLFGREREVPVRMPLPNVWLGVSAERQQEADERIPHLLQTPAAIRFVSCEPLLGPIDLDCPDIDWMKYPEGNGIVGNKLKFDWIIVGGESGPGARRMDARWARSLRDQCEQADIPFFFKQWGAHDSETFDRVGKKSAGRLLDGKEHNTFPKVTA